MAKRVSETILFVRDMDEAVHFYTHQLGFKLEVRHEWGFTVFNVDGDNRIGLMLDAAWDREFPDDDLLPRPRVAIQTDDFEGEMARMRQQGVRFGTIRGLPGDRQAVNFVDQDENPYFLWSDPEESLT